ncbi:glycosyltransferase family 9 protein [Hydrogenobaculum acidophilum]
MDKVLVLRFSSLGDVILTTAVLKPLYDAGFDVYLMTYKEFAPIFQDSSFVKVLEVDKSNMFEVAKGINPNIVVDLHKNLKTFALRSLLKATWFSYNKKSLKRRLCVWFKAFKKENFYITNEYASAVKPILDIKNPKPYLEVKSDRVAKFLSSKPVISLGVGARYDKKRYKHYKELSQMFLKNGFEVRLLGGKDDVTDAYGVNYVGRLSLIETLACIKSSKLVIANDSSITHMARAVGVKVITIFGGTDPCFGFAPKEDEGITVSKDMSCKPCDLHGKGVCKYGNYPCLDVEPRFIFDKAMALLG